MASSASFIGRLALNLNVGRVPRPPVAVMGWLPVLAWMLICVSAWAPARVHAEPPPPMSTDEVAMLGAINAYRVARGRAPWQPEATLAQVARGHSQGMAARGQLSHAGFQRRAAATGSDLCVENLLRGKVRPGAAVQWWKQSLAHHDNLLEAQALYAGVGIQGVFVTMLACASPPLVLPPGQNAFDRPDRPDRPD